MTPFSPGLPTPATGATPLPRGPRSGGCLFCASARCHTRIHTANLGYDQVACGRHVVELERHADATLGKGTVMRNHVSSTARLRRGEPSRMNDAGEIGGAT